MLRPRIGASHRPRTGFSGASSTPCHGGRCSAIPRFAVNTGSPACAGDDAVVATHRGAHVRSHFRPRTDVHFGATCAMLQDSHDPVPSPPYPTRAGRGVLVPRRARPGGRAGPCRAQHGRPAGADRSRHGPQRHGGGAGKARQPDRGRDPGKGRQRGRRRGRGRLCARRDVAEGRQSRRRRVHAGASGGPQRGCRDRLSRGGAARHRAGRLSRPERRGRSEEIARERARRGRARHGRGLGACARSFRLGQVHARRPDRAGARARARRDPDRGRPARFASARAAAAGALAVLRPHLPQARRRGARAGRPAGATGSGGFARRDRPRRRARLL